MSLESLAQIHDRYELTAHFAPAALCLLPGILSIIAWLPPDATVPGAVVSLVTLFGVSYPMSSKARAAGKQIEADFFASIGGTPTTHLLRHRDTRIDAERKRRYHTKLQTLIADIAMPQACDEEQDPERCDLVYESCIRYMRENTRDSSKYPVVMAKNIAYGYWRNSLGIRTTAIFVAIASTSLCVLKLLADNKINVLPLCCGLLCLLITVHWVAEVNKNKLYVAATEYAEHVVSACETIALPAG